MFHFWNLESVISNLESGLHKVNVFFDEANHIWLDEDSSEFLKSEPLISDKSFLFLRFWLSFSAIFHEKKKYIFVDHWWSFEVRSDKWIVDFVHELDDMKLLDRESGFLGYLSQGSLHSLFVFLDMSLRENVFKSSTSLFEGKHENLNLRSLFPIHNTASTLFMEFCHSIFYKTGRSISIFFKNTKK